jgi:hypothetical protein
MSVIARRIAICQHPNGEGVWWDVHDEAEPTCIQDCDCKPVVYVRADTTQGAVEALEKIGALARNEHVGATHALQNIARLVDEAEEQIARLTASVGQQL